MYSPKHFQNKDEATLKQLVAENGFATLISNDIDTGIPMVTHLPLQLSCTRLVGHMARLNPHWKMFDGTCQATAIFHGPHAYISPNWYKSDGLVPTWNYITVHITGTPRTIEDLDELKSTLVNLSRQYEDVGPDAWSSDLLGDKKLDAMARGIIAIEMTGLDWVGKFKLGQNKKAEDQDAVALQHQNSNRDDDEALAKWMAKLQK